MCWTAISAPLFPLVSPPVADFYLKAAASVGCGRGERGQFCSWERGEEGESEIGGVTQSERAMAMKVCHETLWCGRAETGRSIQTVGNDSCDPSGPLGAALAPRLNPPWPSQLLRSLSRVEMVGDVREGVGEEEKNRQGGWEIFPYPCGSSEGSGQRVSAEQVQIVSSPAVHLRQLHIDLINHQFIWMQSLLTGFLAASIYRPICQPLCVFCLLVMWPSLHRQWNHKLFQWQC